MVPIDCESRIARVVVYARGAVITRRVALPEALPDAAFELRIPGLPALAEAGSVRALVEGEREVTALRARIAVPAGAPRPGSLRETRRALALEGERLRAQRSALTKRRDQLGELGITPSFSRWARRADPAARFADALALGGLVAEETAQLDARVAELDAALDENRRLLDAAELDAAQGTAAELAGADRPSLEVLVRIAAAKAARCALSIEYTVGAARWWPAYAARFSAGATRVALALDAFVAQSSGEDWAGVALSVSTADLADDARLPELRSLRIGRAQPPARRGYRPPPAGLDAMFEGYDRAAEPVRSRREPPIDDLFDEPIPHAIDVRARVPTPPMQQSLTRAGSLPEGAMFDGGYPSLGGAASYGAPAPGGGGPPMGAPGPQSLSASIPAFARMQSAPRPKSAGSAAPRRRSSSDALLEESAGMHGAAAEPEEPPPALEPTDGWLDFDALRLADPLAADLARRGRLVREAIAPSGATPARSAIDALAGPTEARDPRDTRGRFDHRYDAEGTADVPANGRPHRVAIAVADAAARPRFVTVPRETAEVYREAEIDNPFPAPLLAGPVEIFLDGALLTTSSLAFVDRRGRLRLGLGVEERLRVARNARVEEGSAGLLGGSAAIEHTITVDLSSSLGLAAEIEVFDRIPITDDKDIDVKLLYARPEPEKYTQADRGAPIRRGLRWKVTVPAGEKLRLEHAYRVTLPAKNEILGGNRRE